MQATYKTELRNGAALDGDAESVQELRDRLANANDYFARKAGDVLIDELALRLLATLYQEVVVDSSETGVSPLGIALAKLTAANLCEVDADSVFITKSGQKFIDAILDA